MPELNIAMTTDIQSSCDWHLQELVASGSVLNLRMERLTAMIGALNAAKKWMGDAGSVLAMQPDTPFPQRPALDEVPSLILLPSCAVKLLNAKCICYSNSQNTTPEHATQLERLLTAHAQLAVDLPEAIELAAKKASAEAWLVQAWTLVDKPLSKERADVLQVRIMFWCSKRAVCDI